MFEGLSLPALQELQFSSSNDPTAVIDGQREIQFITGSIAVGSGANATSDTEANATSSQNFDSLTNKLLTISGLLFLAIIVMRAVK